VQRAMDNKPLCVIVLGIAFVALVLPFDSFRGLREQTRGPFFRAGGSHSSRETGGSEQEGQSNFNIEV
jgi:hypothetical protein